MHVRGRPAAAMLLLALTFSVGAPPTAAWSATEAQQEGTGCDDGAADEARQAAQRAGTAAKEARGIAKKAFKVFKKADKRALRLERRADAGDATDGDSGGHGEGDKPDDGKKSEGDRKKADGDRKKADGAGEKSESRQAAKANTATAGAGTEKETGKGRAADRAEAARLAREEAHAAFQDMEAKITAFVEARVEAQQARQRANLLEDAECPGPGDDDGGDVEGAGNGSVTPVRTGSGQVIPVRADTGLGGAAGASDALLLAGGGLLALAAAFGAHRSFRRREA